MKEWDKAVYQEPWVLLKMFYIDEGVIYLQVSVPSLNIEPLPYTIKEDNLRKWIEQRGYMRQTEYDMKTGKYLYHEIQWEDFKELHLTMPILEKYLNV